MAAATWNTGIGCRPRRALAGAASFLAHDPYCDLYKGLADDALGEMVEAGRATVQPRSGFDRPVVLRGMGEHTLHDEAAIVRTVHSACVLSEEVMERSRLTVREFYGQAAEEPKAELCCPVQPAADDLAHIPPEVIVERFYGCGRRPVAAAALVPGETMVDLGSGAGIDCFIAAKKVGADGHVYGIDMTDPMLAVAQDCQPQVAAALGYDVVEFRKGYLEQIPLAAATADVVTSNCVINLSADKPRVFREIWRVLRDHGRAVRTVVEAVPTWATVAASRSWRPRGLSEPRRPFSVPWSGPGSTGCLSCVSRFGERSRGAGSIRSPSGATSSRNRLDVAMSGSTPSIWDRTRRWSTRRGICFRAAHLWRCARTRSRSCRILRTQVRSCLSTVRPGHVMLSPMMTPGAGRACC